MYADYDGDGDVDLFLVNVGQEGVLFENTLNGDNHYLIVDLEGVLSNRDGIGAKLKLTTPDGGIQYWETRSGSSLGGGDDRAAYFGLGANTTVSSLEITWPSGTVQVLEDLQPDQRLLVKESVLNTNNESADALPEFSLTTFPNPFQNELHLNIHINRPSVIELEMYDVLGRLVAAPTQLSLTASQHTIPWHITQSQLPAGMYIIRATINNQVQHQRFVIKK